MVWPVGMGLNFRGTIDLYTEEFSAFGSTEKMGANAVAALLTPEEKDKLDEDVELARSGMPRFDHGTYREGHLTPVYFGSALKNFGVRDLLSALATNAPPPGPAPTRGRTVEPSDEEVTGFVFKVQANMDPNHRDRVAFVRLASGRFHRGMKLIQSGTGKSIGIHNPILFFAQERETVDEAWPGDIIGIPNHGVLRVGDTLSESGEVVFTGIPNFAPEILRRVRLGDPMKQKHLTRALDKPCRGRRDAGVQAADRRGLDRRRGRSAAARRSEVAPARRIRPRCRSRSLRPTKPHAGSAVPTPT